MDESPTAREYLARPGATRGRAGESEGGACEDARRPARRQRDGRMAMHSRRRPGRQQAAPRDGGLDALSTREAARREPVGGGERKADPHTHIFHRGPRARGVAYGGARVGVGRIGRWPGLTPALRRGGLRAHAGRDQSSRTGGGVS